MKQRLLSIFLKSRKGTPTRDKSFSKKRTSEQMAHQLQSMGKFGQPLLVGWK